MRVMLAMNLGPLTEFGLSNGQVGTVVEIWDAAMFSSAA